MDEPKPTTEELLARMVGLLERIEQQLARAPEPLPRLISVDDACELLGCKRTKAFELIEDGELKTRHIGKKVMVTSESLEACIAGPRARPRKRQAGLEGFEEEMAEMRRAVLKKPAAGRRGA